MAVRSELHNRNQEAQRQRRDTAGMVLGLAMIATGLSAGLLYSYACSVLPGLGQTSDRTFIDAMQQINKAIQNPVFFASFFGALALTAVAAAQQRRLGPGAATRWTVAALALYALALLVTVGCQCAAKRPPRGRRRPRPHRGPGSRPQPFPGAVDGLEHRAHSAGDRGTRLPGPCPATAWPPRASPLSGVQPAFQGHSGTKPCYQHVIFSDRRLQIPQWGHAVWPP